VDWLDFYLSLLENCTLTFIFLRAPFFLFPIPTMEFSLIQFNPSTMRHWKTGQSDVI